MSANYLAEVLRIAPSTWTGTTYTSTNYATVQVEEYSDEYADIVNDLRAENSSYAEGINKIERVQHPFAYGRFVLRKEQLEKRCGYSQAATRYFIQINTSQIKEALEYNMDRRRTPYVNAYSWSTRSSNTCVVVVKGLQNPSSVDRDSEIYPEYVVYYD